MASAGTVYVDVRAEMTGFIADIRRAASGLDGGKGLLLGAAAGTTALAAGLGAVGFAAVDASTDFNKSMSGVGAVANATESDLKALSDAALKAGADTSFSASEAATAEAELARAGVSVADILGGGLTGALSLAAAGQLDLGTAAEITGQALNIFNLEGDQASRVADVLASGANKSAADVGNLGQALQQSGLVASQLGIGLEDTVGVLSLFADNALLGSDAGTSFKTMLQRLVPQSQEQADAMDQLGLSFFTAQGQFVGLEETANRLQKALGGLTEEQRSAALTTIFGSDSVRAAGILYSAGAKGVDEYTRAVQDQGAAQRVAATQLDNLSGDIEALSGSWETLLISLGQSADTGLRDVVQGATGFVNDLTDALDSPEVSAVTDKIASGFDGLSDTLGEVASGIGDVFSSVDSDTITGVLDMLGSVSGAGVQALGTGLQVAGTGISLFVDAASVAMPIVGTLADLLGAVADQGWLIQGALSAVIAVKVVDKVGAWVERFQLFRGSLAATLADLERQGAAMRASQAKVAAGVETVGSAAAAAHAPVVGLGGGLAALGAAPGPLAASANVAGIGAAASTALVQVSALKTGMAGLDAATPTLVPPPPLELTARAGVIDVESWEVFDDVAAGVTERTKVLSDATETAGGAVSRLGTRAGNVARGAIARLSDAIGAANVGTVGLTAAITAGLTIYQNWNTDIERVETTTRSLTDALIEQQDVAATTRLAKIFSDAIGSADGLDEAFNKAGIAVSTVTNAMNADAAQTAEAFKVLGPILREPADGAKAMEVLQNRLGTLSPEVRNLVEQFLAARDAGALEGGSMLRLARIMEETARAAAGSSAALGVQAQRFKEGAEGTKLSADAQRDLNTALDDTAPIEDRRSALQSLIKAYPDIAEAEGIAANSARDATDAQGSFAGMSGVVERAVASMNGVIIEAADGFDLLSEAARKSLNNVTSFSDAQDAATDAIKAQEKARLKLADIERGVSPALIAAKDQLKAADDDLAKALEDNADRVQDALDKLLDAQDRLAEAREKGAALASGGVAGDIQTKPDLSVARDIGAAQRAVADAQREYDRLKGGQSDQIVSARDRVADAQKRVNEELAKTGPNSEAAREAQDDLDAASKRVRDTTIQLSEAMGKLSAGDIPKAINALQALGQQYPLAKESLDELIGSMLVYSALSGSTPTTTAPTVPTVASVGQRIRDALTPKIGGGRAYGGPAYDDQLHPVVERGMPEMFTDRAGRSYVLPPAGGGTVTPLGADGTAGDMLAVLRRIASLLESGAVQPHRTEINNFVPAATPDQRSRDMANAGFR